jgi:photosystem II stability/assembly factor-like uncharacterized protein
MKGDFSRIRNNPEKNYTRVLRQQGRVDLDSDWNEQSAILDQLDRTKAINVIGHCGVPKKGGGFKIKPSGFLNDVAFPSSTNGWAVGNDANIIFTTDGGATWQKIEPPAGVAVNLRKVVFPATDTGWIAGDDATILKIEPDPQNGGSMISKQPVQLKMPVRLLSISFVNGNTNNGWATGDNATLLATKDGGNTWTSQSAPAGIKVGLKDIFFISATIGWAVGENATILHTADGGANWEQQTAPTTISGTLRSLHFNLENDGWIVGDDGVILHTTDGGQNWNSQPGADINIHLQDVFFETNVEGWIVGDKGTILHITLNLHEKNEWKIESSGLSATLRAVYFESTGLGCIVGNSGAILTRQEGSTVWNGQSLPDDFRFSLVASDGRIYVDGLSCDLDKRTSYFNQPDYPNPPPINKVDQQTDLVYLDVWERHITAIEDPDIREVALGGPDTTTRVKTVCQIKIEPNVDKKNCEQKIDSWPPEPGKGRLTTRTEADATSDQPCIIAPGGGYRGLDNRFYRVEIHTPGDIGTATFKWSRDNGSVVYAIEKFEAGDPKQVKVKQLGKDEFLSLKKGDWVEILGDETELKGKPGTIAQIDDIKEAQRIVILSADISTHSAETHPKIRRWDQKTETTLVNPGKISLEKGIEIEFSGEELHTGDYWVFAARTATANVEELTDQPPMGIRHYYCKLALVTWHQQGNGKWQADITDCRKDFPSLTEICAEDICFDNSNCELAEAETVQDAIDRLCKANNLRFHNKHLHGWGIVCGLQVYCGDGIENGRMTVKVKEGYALDCDGNDLVIQQDKTLQIMEMIKKQGLLDGEDGEVCLTMGMDDNNQLAFNVEPYDPDDKSNSWKGGELVENIYNNCLKPVVEFFTKEVTGDGEETALVGIHQKRITSLLNLLIQFLTPEFGKNVYISPQEDKILRQLYDALKELLKSKTYCAMFDNVEQFPDYPGALAELNIPTIFSKGFTHTRIRVDHQSKRAYTVGGLESPSGSNMIFVFDLNAQQMVAEVEFPGGKGIKVQDVAFSANGTELYAIGMLNDEDTIFAVADIKEEEQLIFTWRPIKTFCSTLMVTLATIFDSKSSVYAIARGKGLYVIDPNSIETFQNPAVPFSASGQLVIDHNTHIAYATLGEGLNDPLQYNQIWGIYLNDKPEVLQYFYMNDQQGRNFVGEDDIEIAHIDNGTRLCVVSNAIPGTSGNKNLLVYQIPENNGAFEGNVDYVLDLEADTDIKIAFNTATKFLMVIYEDSYRVRLVSIFNAKTPQLLDSYHHPVQIYPESIAMGSPSDNTQVYVYNWVSNTFNIIPADRFQPEAIFPLEVLTAYRNDVLEAYIGLFSKLIQYLKDCICDQLLLKCPTCDEEDKLYLACVSIRENQVYKVCNFSKRKYVKSFPAFDYWLSWIPIGPLVRKAVETACCAVLPDLFGNINIGGEKQKGINMKGTQMKYGIASLKNFNFDTMFKERKTQSSVLQGLAGDWLGNLTKKQVTAPERTVKQAAMVGKPVDEVKTKLENANIEVTRTEAFDPLNGPKNLMKFTMSPTNLKENSRVVLYEENGKVKYYALEDKGPANVEELRTQINTQKAKIEEVTALQTEVSKLKTQLEAVQGAHQKALSSRDKQIEELQKSVTQISKITTDFESLKTQVTQLSKIRIAPPKKRGFK